MRQSSRVILGADRLYTGPDCPPEMLDVGGVPQGDYAPAPWLLSSAGWAAWAETAGPGAEFAFHDRVEVSTRAIAGPLRLHLLCDATPAARLRHYLRLTGFPALLLEWAYGHWKSRDVYEHQDDVVEDWRGYRAHDLPLDAIVIDSPWETQYNTWRFNPHQFPDPEGLVRDMRADAVRTVVWITPWVNLESIDGQRPPDAASERLHREPAPNYAEGAAVGHFVRGADGRPHVGRWWMGTGSIVDFTSADACRWWRELARPAFELGVEGVKADDSEGYYVPPDARLADGRTGAEAAWELGGLYRRTTQEALDDVHPGSGVVFGRSGWTGQQAIGMLWGGDQVSDFWSLRALLTSLLTAAASGFSNLSHDVGGYLGKRLTKRCDAELLVRWAQLGALTPPMQAHGRFEQEAWAYDEETLDRYRDAVVLHERLVPYIRAAAASAARTGVPIMRPLCITDPDDPEGWDRGRVWPRAGAVGGAGRRRGRPLETRLLAARRVDRLVDRRPARGRPLDRRRGAARPDPAVGALGDSIVVTYPAADVARGLGEENPGRPIEATLWGEPPLGHSIAQLADGTRIGWRRGAWSLSRERPVSFAGR